MKRIISLLAAIAVAATVMAQNYERANILGLTIGGGIHTMAHTPADGAFKLGNGFDGGLQYAHFFGRHFGIGLGAHYSFATSVADYSFAEDLTEPGNTPITATYDGWRERQEAGFVSVPLELLWRQPLGGRWSLFFGVGAQVDLNLHGRYIADRGSVMVISQVGGAGTETTVYEHDASASSLEGGLDRLDMGVSALADLGVRVALSEHCGIYLGVYGSYGIKEYKVGNDFPMLEGADPYQYFGSYASNQVDAARLLSAGVKVGFDIGWGGKKRKQHSSHDRGNDMVGYEVDPAESMARQRNRPPVRREEPTVVRNKRDDVRHMLDAIEATVYFESSGITPAVDQQTYDVLRFLCDAMNEDPTLRITVAGHTDNTGSVEVNMEYGMRRAEALKAYLVGLGAPADNIDCESRGKTQPVASNDTEEGRARNRRATVSIQ